MPRQPQPLKGGSEFQSPDVRALQADEFANPGRLWVERGKRLWSQARGEAGNSCESCHGDAAKSMRGAAVRYPKHDPALGRVVDLEERVNACVTGNQRARPLPWESEELLALTTYVARQSQGSRIDVSIEGPAQSTYERGRRIYFERQGQLNLACTHCHDANWGRTLLAEKVSQGHPVDWPAFRLEWQTLGSLQRRLRACYFGVRAELPAFGAPDLVALEFYLAARARGLPISAPGVRR
ncbi:MAG: sulfur oxidation c-type cytochrome SoxA [Usitatibacter sp.]